MLTPQKVKPIAISSIKIATPIFVLNSPIVLNQPLKNKIRIITLNSNTAKIHLPGSKTFDAQCLYRHENELDEHDEKEHHKIERAVAPEKIIGFKMG